MKPFITLCLLGLMAGPLPAAEQHLDSVILSDGTRLTGLVVEDGDKQVVLQDQGVERKLSRSRVLKIQYNDPDAPLNGSTDTSPQDESQAPTPVEALTPTDDPALTDYCNGIAEQYQVPIHQVVYVEQQVPLEEVPVVFALAARAHVAPGVVLSLRLGGLSWSQVGLHFGFGNDIFYVDGGVDLIGTPYEHLYRRFWSQPRFRWNSILLSDADIIDCINLSFVHSYYHRPYVEVARVRRSGPVYRHVWREQAERHDEARFPAPRRSDARPVVVERDVHRTVVVHPGFKPDRQRVLRTQRVKKTVVVHNAAAQGGHEGRQEGGHEGGDHGTVHPVDPEPTQEHADHGVRDHGQGFGAADGQGKAHGRGHRQE